LPRGHLVAAPDKFGGTATAREIAAAAARGARRCGWTAAEVPMADGGEGLLDVMGGEARRTEVTGPLGHPVAAEWHLLPGPDGSGPVAVIEMARAAGRALMPAGGAALRDGHGGADDGVLGDAPLRATTTGVGELVLAARDAGATTIIVGCGGAATTDGGWGAVSAVGAPDALDGVSLVVAADVRTGFVDAARIFGPQKGADAAQVRALTARLERLARRYRRELGVDVTELEGAGAAGGLAGGLAALGGRIVAGFDLVAGLVDLPRHLAAADLVVTGEGRLDVTSLEGKVVVGVIDMVRGRVPVLCIVGSADRGALGSVPAGVDVIDLVSLVGVEEARRRAPSLVEAVVADRLSGS
jgi:glycerate kinase